MVGALGTYLIMFHSTDLLARRNELPLLRLRAALTLHRPTERGRSTVPRHPAVGGPTAESEAEDAAARRGGAGKSLGAWG